MKQRDLVGFESDLGFRAKPSVRWLVPSELARAAVQVVVAQTFANYADKREIQAVLKPEPVAIEGSGSATELWIDFVADLGDGFDATFTIASLLAQDELSVTTPYGDVVTLPRGRLLVMGGDEVYPTASSRAYEDRTTGPYSAADVSGTDRATLLALPGNHDWYDGLTAFLRVFTHGRSIGSWRTAQTRSYFAAQLRPGWWLVGLDSQLGEYIDQPQLDYFYRQVSCKLQPGDAIILCCASPAWEKRSPDAFNSLHYFERNFLRNRRVSGSEEVQPTGASVRLWISGDHHHYVRYEEEIPGVEGPDLRRSQLITCGLGGAYLMGAEDTAARITLPPTASRMRDKDPIGTTYRRGPAVFPDRSLRRRLCWQLANPFSAYWLPFRNPWFGFTLGTIHLTLVLCLCWVLSVSRSMSIGRALREADSGAALAVTGFVLGAPLLIFWVLLGIQALRRGGWHSSDSPGIVGVTAQFLVSLLLFELLIAVPLPPNTPLALALAAVIVAFGGAFLGSEAFALYVILAPQGVVGDLKMTGLACEDGKGFLRMHFTATGDLEVFPIVVDEVCRDWTLNYFSPGRARPVAENGLPEPRMIEEPVLIGKHGVDRKGIVP